ncbi:MAG: inositol monophosphatase family protein [Campylobacterota bacterium]|nr:inositol monophosphatase family protein [Campylobacterota bacterium]
MQKIEILKSIAIEAGKIIQEGYNASKELHFKGIVDIVTQYDVAVEKFVIAKLQEHFDDYTLIGEESHQGSYHHEKAIYIDPIDGTTNFVHGIPHLALSIGVWEDSKPTMAVVYNPILNELFWAVRGEGAYLNDKKLNVSNQKSLQQSLLATGFPYAKVNRGVEYHWVIDSMANLLPNIRDIRRLGAAALDLCYVAQGKIDGFYEIDLKPWDVAGGILILLEAGGEVVSLSQEYQIGDKVIVATNGKITQELCSFLSKLPR